MANKVRARAELSFRNFPYNGSEQDKDQARWQAFKHMYETFKRKCKDYGIAAAYKEHEYFESKPAKDRRKRKEAELRRLKDERYEKFGPQKPKDKDGKSKKNKG